MEKLRIGTRASDLAVHQAERVKKILSRSGKELDVEIEKIKTKGDRILDKPLSEIGGKGVFLKEIEKYLLEGEIDLAVHSLKDVPTSLPEGLEIGAYLDREDPRDCFVSLEYDDLDQLPSYGIVGTGSLRRQTQLLRRRLDLEIEPIRGNVNTRLEKLETEDYDALILAVSGLKRLGFEDMITSYLPPDRFLPAPGQGVLAVEIREKDDRSQRLLKEVEKEELRGKMIAERGMLKHLGGDCHVPVGCHSEVLDDRLTLTALVGSKDGREHVEVRAEAPFEKADELGVEVADRLLRAGADRFLDLEDR